MKKNKKKKKLNIIKLLVFILIFYIIIYSIYSLFNMKIRNIVIKGNTYLKDYEIIEQANIKDYPPMLTLNKNKTIRSNKRCNNKKIFWFYFNYRNSGKENNIRIW